MSDQNNGERGLQEPRTRSFNPNEHLRKIKSGNGAQDYLDVKWRLVWFRERYPHGRIETQELAYDLDREVEAEGSAWNPETRRSERVIKKARGYARYRAIVEDGEGGQATGTKSENAANFPDFGEKAETGAIGRALAGLGFGTQFAPELNEEHRIVDAPVDRAPVTPPSADRSNGNGRKSTESTRPTIVASKASNADHSEMKTSTEVASEMYATEQQLASIRKLREVLGRDEPEHEDAMTYAKAGELIQELNRERRESREGRKAS
ncbi:MAG: hypothetical protein M3Z08_24360 [Chloroflexota bacterium]|nr:hypothetical protein [Chloroflexota bacterium]